VPPEPSGNATTVTTVAVRVSIPEAVLSPLLLTQTWPPAGSTARRVGWVPTDTVDATDLVAVSIPTTVFDPNTATHTRRPSGLVAIPLGLSPTTTGDPTIAPEAASTSMTVPAGGLVTHR